MKYIERVTMPDMINDNRLVGYVVCDYNDVLEFNTNVKIKKTTLNDMLQVIETTMWLVTNENESIAKRMAESYINSMSMSGNKFEIIGE